jgi:hypothetical protein
VSETINSKACSKCTRSQPLSEFMGDTNEPDKRSSWCNGCRIKVGRQLSEFRRLSVVNQTAQRISIGEDLLTVLASPLGPTVERLLDALSGLTESTSSSSGNNPDKIRTGRPQHAPLPRFYSVWADRIQSQTDDQLWELSENLLTFLNRPEDPSTWAICDTCGNKRLGESSYCGNCGARILAGARRCRLDGCPNEGKRRALCPDDVPHGD